jgi:pimeloyl-ACP methyl ester carboxylesterase
MSAPRPILIHGAGGGHRVWEPLATRLAGAVALELPGHPDGDALDDVGDIARAIAEALARIPPPRALVGHSLGGAAALEAARTRPELVDGLVVVASGARLPVPGHAMARVRDDFAAERDRLLAGFAADPAGAAVRAARDAIDACGPDVLEADYAACRSVDLRGGLDGVRVPVLVVVGADDPLTPPWMSEELARELPQAHMVVIPGARHLPMADVPATLSALVAAYLARLELTLTDA